MKINESHFPDSNKYTNLMKTNEFQHPDSKHIKTKKTHENKLVPISRIKRTHTHTTHTHTTHTHTTHTHTHTHKHENKIY